MKRILSIDGGGTRGLIPAIILNRLQQELDQPIAHYFDLIAGTSTGGLIALALSQPDSTTETTKELVELYRKRGKEIFPQSFFSQLTSLWGLLRRKYSHQPYEEFLEEQLESSLFHSEHPKLLITSYDILAREPLFFKSWRSEHRELRRRDIARATSAAPTYFEPFQLDVPEKKEEGGKDKKRVLIDGGIFINSPTVSAYVEAKRLALGEPKLSEASSPEKDFFALSLGTGEFAEGISYHSSKNWGKIGWLSPLLDCMSGGVANATDYQMDLLLESNYIRLQPKLKEFISLDDTSPPAMEKLKAAAEQLLSEKESEIERIISVLKKKITAPESSVTLTRQAASAIA